MLLKAEPADGGHLNEVTQLVDIVELTSTDVGQRKNKPLSRLADRRGRKAGLNWKLQISNTADNADIAQSQARDTRHRRMQEVYTACVQIAEPVGPNTVLRAFHTIQPSFFPNIVVFRNKYRKKNR